MLFDAALADVSAATVVVVDADPLAASPFPPDGFCPDVDVVAPAVAADPTYRWPRDEWLACFYTFFPTYIFKTYQNGVTYHLDSEAVHLNSNQLSSLYLPIRPIVKIVASDLHLN